MARASRTRRQLALDSRSWTTGKGHPGQDLQDMKHVLTARIGLPRSAGTEDLQGSSYGPKNDIPPPAILQYLLLTYLFYIYICPL
jgi:hypothetical protein